MGGTRHISFYFIFLSPFVPEGRSNFINRSTGTVANPVGPLNSAGAGQGSVDWRGMGVAPGFEDLISVVLTPLLHVDHVRRVPTLNRSSAEMEDKGASS